MQQIFANPDHQPRQPKFRLKPIGIGDALILLGTAGFRQGVGYSPVPTQETIDNVSRFRFAVQVVDEDGAAIGLAVCGNSAVQQLADPYTLQILLGWNKGDAQSQSMLWLAAWRTGRAMGYRRMLGYFRKDESCTPLVAASLMRLHGQFGMQVDCLGQIHLAWGRGEWDFPAPGQFSIN